MLSYVLWLCNVKTVVLQARHSANIFHQDIIMSLSGLVRICCIPYIPKTMWSPDRQKALWWRNRPVGQRCQNRQKSHYQDLLGFAAYHTFLEQCDPPIDKALWWRNRPVGQRRQNRQKSKNFRMFSTQRSACWSQHSTMVPLHHTMSMYICSNLIWGSCPKNTERVSPKGNMYYCPRASN